MFETNLKNTAEVKLGERTCFVFIILFPTLFIIFVYKQRGIIWGQHLLCIFSKQSLFVLEFGQTGHV